MGSALDEGKQETVQLAPQTAKVPGTLNGRDLERALRLEDGRLCRKINEARGKEYAYKSSLRHDVRGLPLCTDYTAESRSMLASKDRVGTRTAKQLPRCAPQEETVISRYYDTTHGTTQEEQSVP